ncbi:uncharacterized protein DUF4167 [Rhodovulum adriaticum]|uniref:Uncharacterized protein DUF4167 n=2 Tax=Rhodovulum adriaticum TaxID=35804 RepID=A0A4R2NN28_RHOAD|nr:uncharacterized protein DUF4167 [Rhodovulum adriaticum]
MGNIVNRVFDSSGPEGKVRGTPQQIIDKYNQLARDAQLGNDRIAAENFQQHAEHYARLLGEAQRSQEAKRDRDQQEAQAREQRRPRDDSGDEDQGAPRNQDTQPDKPAADASGTDGGADVIDLNEGGEDSALVETPEEKPASRPRRAPRPRGKAKAAKADEDGTGEDDTPSASTPDEAPAAE